MVSGESGGESTHTPTSKSLVILAGKVAEIFGNSNSVSKNEAILCPAVFKCIIMLLSESFIFRLAFYAKSWRGKKWMNIYDGGRKKGGTDF